jgi:tripartite ATP-independent transporter DctM subunit
MTGGEIVLITLFGTFLLLGVPFAFAIGIATLVTMIVEGISPVVLAQQLISGVSGDSLLSIPCFVLAGDLMYTGGLSRRLVNVAMVLLGRLPGGAAIVAVASATAFGAITGSANATTAAIGKATIPEMIKRGYAPNFSAALAAAYGPIGILIPPSIPLIVWGVIANQSITKLFIAGIIPGLLIALGLMIVCYIHAKRRNIPIDPGRFSFRAFLSALNEGKWALLAPVIVLGGIYGGVFTPTEAGAVGVLYGCLVGLLNGETKPKELPQILLRSMKTSAIILYVVGMSSALSWMMGFNRLPDRLGSALLSVSSNHHVILLLINLLLLIVGSFMDELAAIIILSTFLIQVGNQIGIDPIHFGVIIVTNLAVGLTHPPMGYTLFTASAVSGVPADSMIRPIIPLVAVELVVLMIVSYVPDTTLFFLRFLG